MNLVGGTKTETLAHWCKLVEDFNYSPLEFYRLVEKNLEKRQIPGLHTGRFNLAEGGLFSAEREYIRLQRERLTFDVCAAPFGTGYFISSRMWEEHLEAGLLHYLVASVPLLAIGAGCMWKYGWLAGVYAMALVFCLVWSLMRLAVTNKREELAEWLLRLPVLGPIFESLFRPDTYFRQDAKIAYNQSVHNALMQSMDEMTTAKGIRPLTADERKPAFFNLHRK